MLPPLGSTGTGRSVREARPEQPGLQGSIVSLPLAHSHLGAAGPVLCAVVLRGIPSLPLTWETQTVLASFPYRAGPPFALMRALLQESQLEPCTASPTQIPPGSV